MSVYLIGGLWLGMMTLAFIARRIFVLIREDDARAGDFARTVTFLHFH